MSNYKKLELAGKRFGRLIALCDSRKRYQECVVWLCKCDCGNLKLVKSHNLKRGSTKSCGCWRDDIFYKHGDATRGRGEWRLYNAWANMRQRCKNVNDVAYKWYGGKGIGVCKEWKDDYVAFKNWALNSGYEDNLTLHRKDSNGNYGPSNCQWITRSANTIKAINLRVAKSMPIHFTTA